MGKMDSIKNIFTGKGESSSRETSEAKADVPVIEVDEKQEMERMGEIEPIIVKSVDLNGFVDVQEVSNELRNGNIVILNISPLMDENPNELERAVEQLKGVAEEIGGDVGRLSESRIIATPDLVRIEYKRKA